MRVNVAVAVRNRNERVDTRDNGGLNRKNLMTDLLFSIKMLCIIYIENVLASLSIKVIV